MRIYLDNCCYNRPYDDQTQIRIYTDTEAKINIQTMIKNREIELVSSYVLDYENSRNRSEQKKESISDFIIHNESFFVGSDRSTNIDLLKVAIMKTGVKEKDACHVACAIFAHCDYFITTDDRLLKYKDKRIKLVSPCEFIKLYKEGNL